MYSWKSKSYWDLLVEEICSVWDQVLNILKAILIPKLSQTINKAEENKVQVPKCALLMQVKLSQEIWIKFRLVCLPLSYTPSVVVSSLQAIL